MTISVVIATYNRAALLESTLDELGRQAFEPGDEVIVVDNASTDRTPDVIARAIEKFPVRIRHLREATPGKTPAMNRGIAVARGDILALTDDDVFLARTGWRRSGACSPIGRSRWLADGSIPGGSARPRVG